MLALVKARVYTESIFGIVFHNMEQLFRMEREGV